jgi:D-alanyl-D-alanine carboxypeptidase
MKTGHDYLQFAPGGYQWKQASILFLCSFFLVFLVATPVARAIDASIVIDANTDTVVSQLNPDRLLHPASMSKLMTLYLTFEALEQGRITLQRTLPVSAHAESMSPTKLGLAAGESIRVEDAILSLVTLSANDAAVVLAEGLGGSEDRFGQLMTRKAHQLGMVNTNFRNSNGLPDPAQISTARDMAILCRALIKRFPSYYHYFSVREFTYNGIEYTNHNHLMSRYEGMDGLKTGLTNASGFNLAASAVRNGRRLIGVVFGGTSAIQRDDYMAELLDEGFHSAGSMAMTTALPPPIPAHKPTDLTSAAVPSPNPGDIPLPPTPTPLLASPSLVSPSKPASIGALAAANGEGDIESPEDTRRTTPALQIAIAAPAPRPAGLGKTSSKAAPAQTPPSADKSSKWSIQVGAFATRKAGEQAIQQAMRRAPVLLQNAIAAIATLPKNHATVYRARLTGLDAADARKACHLLAHCQTVPPGA